jgi:hypothetical protein
VKRPSALPAQETKQHKGIPKKERFSRFTTAYSETKRRHRSDDKLAGRGADTWHSPTMKSNRWHMRVSSISSFTARGRVLGACHTHDGRRDIAAKCRRAIEPGPVSGTTTPAQVECEGESNDVQTHAENV